MTKQQQISRNHHYIPIFYLKKWADKDTGKIKKYSIPYDMIKERSVFPSGTSFEKDLYSRSNLPKGLQDSLETSFLQKIDDDAAKVHEKLINNIIPKSDEDRSDWVRFIFSIVHRTPERIKITSQKYNEYMGHLKNFIENSDKISQDIKDKMLIKLPKMVDESFNHLITILHNPERSGNLLINQEWKVLEFSCDSIITSDHPIVIGMYNGHLDFRGVMLMAISPKHLFLSSQNTRILNEMEKTKDYIARKYNKIVCMKAATEVYASFDFVKDIRHIDFIFKNFQKMKPENFGIYDDCRDINLKPPAYEKLLEGISSS